MSEPTFTIGIEEEYLLIDKTSRDLKPVPEELMEQCMDAMEGQVSPEFLQCQIEVGTRPCSTVAEARENLAKLRSTIVELSSQHGLAPIAASAHPFATWQSQKFTDKARYRSLARDLAAVAERMLICGMHVHVGIDEDDLRIDLLNQFSYFLPHLLALSTSSPFWEGHDMGLNSYRLSVFDNLPRTGLPPVFASHAEYRRSIQVIIDSGLIEDATKIWWDIRLSDRFPTLETRICDVSPLLDDAICIAAIIRCVLRMLFRLRRSNQRWRLYDQFLIRENRWRAQRYGTREGLIDFGRGEVVKFDELVDELLDLIQPDAEALDCTSEVERARQIVANGTSADRQRKIHQKALADGKSESEAMCDVVDSLISETASGL